MLEDDKNPNTLRNFNPYKKGLKKVPQIIPKIKGGGQGCLEKIQTEADFSSDGFPYKSVLSNINALGGFTCKLLWVLNQLAHSK